REREIIDGINLARRDVRRVRLAAIDEGRIRQHDAQRVLDPRVEIALLTPGLEEVEQQTEILLRDRPAIGPACKCRQDFLGARELLDVAARPAREDARAARRLAAPGRDRKST